MVDKYHNERTDIRGGITMDVREKTVTAMNDECKWMQDEVCVNADCPACADYCPVADTPGVCKYEERGNSDAQKGKRQTGAE